ncbi:hypothetical protein ACFE04_028450 [Oxalis oulophora]
MRENFQVQQQGNGGGGGLSLSDNNYFTDNIWKPFLKSPKKTPILFFIIFALLVGAFVTTRLLDPTRTISSSSILSTTTIKPTQNAQTLIPIDYPLNCSQLDPATNCSRDSHYPKSVPEDPDQPSPPTCPEYFRWIHEDLRPWARTGITRELLENARRTANFKLVILDGKAYVETYEKGFQTRDVFTLWGFLQLLRKYPGKVPDLELMFDCVDWPVVRSSDYVGPDAPGPPPLFRYCGDDNTLDIVFPDWSFWGWAEINIQPWEHLLEDLKEGNKKTKWIEREPYAYWKGNPVVAATREDLMKCNVSEEQDWNARLYQQDWGKEVEQGFKESNLADQCVHRYKIYIEGSAWSVSQKYILACDSVTLLVTPHYYDFFTRGLMPIQHYWPIKEDDKCRSIKYAVDWGNSHQQKAQGIGKAASKYVREDVKMDYVYDYMLHLLTAYSKLLKFKPSIPEQAIELCVESMACPREGIERSFMMDSLVKYPAETSPCTMPPPYDPSSLYGTIRKRERAMSKVDTWEQKYWSSQSQGS